MPGAHHEPAGWTRRFSKHPIKANPATRKLSAEDEELLRPSRFLGYDRDHLGLYLLTKGLYEVAESEFRRASYLNPYEGSFFQHLAWSLFRQGKFTEAKKWIEESLRIKSDDEDTRCIAERIDRALEGNLRAGA